MPTLDECLSALRYVSSGVEVLTRDINDLKTCLSLLSQIFRSRIGGDPLVDELDAILSKIPYVKAGDVIMPEHHNYLVDAIKKARDILYNLEIFYKSQLDALTNLMIAMLTAPGYVYIDLHMDYYTEITKSIADSFTFEDPQFSGGNIAIDISDSFTFGSVTADLGNQSTNISDESTYI
ncbi:MAG: hypothetical protein C0179_00390 [Fervidicoccus sp.]|nr:MAG: hypothetical protein C0179_00390 [Fervidicoccus sp.]